MSRVTCGIIAGRQIHLVGDREDGYLAECILPAHPGIAFHIVRTPEGELFFWEEDQDCDCGCQEPEADPGERCYSYGQITEEGFINIVLGIISPRPSKKRITA